jgi:Flp pilus assembly pilin Flp
MTSRANGWIGTPRKRDSGQDLLEYGLLTSLIATFLVGTLTLTGTQLRDLWLHISKGF